MKFKPKAEIMQVGKCKDLYYGAFDFMEHGKIRMFKNGKEFKINANMASKYLKTNLTALHANNINKSISAKQK